MNKVITHSCVQSFSDAVKARGLSLCDVTMSRRSGAFLSLEQLGAYLSDALTGLPLAGMELKTRSKYVRSKIVGVLGYPVPKTFGKGTTLPAQNADIYVQKSNNVQVWNEKIDLKRRYIIVVLNSDDTVAGVRAFTGRTLASWSKTGTLTTKYQARLKLVFSDAVHHHVCGRDTERTVQFTAGNSPSGDAGAEPIVGGLLSIEKLAENLSSLIGTKIAHISAVDDKKRSRALLELVAKTLGYSATTSTSAFPALPGQMLEVKLQTTATIDLGRTWPSSDSPLNFTGGRAKLLRRRDARFAVFYGTRVGDFVRLDKVVVTPGSRFWDVFEPLGGNVRNSKLQIKLPAHAMKV